MEEKTPNEASVVNRELTELLVDVGHRMALDVTTEYAVPGGRIDVVWSWPPPVPLPGLAGALAIVGFEIESSWRTRKHVKGDLLNLQDAGVALGVIVLAGGDARDESLRRFATTLVERPGSKMVVWTEGDVRKLAAGGSTATAIEVAAAEAADHALRKQPSRSSTSGDQHTGKHRQLWSWLRRQEGRELHITFHDLEAETGIVPPDSCRTHPPHWYSYQGSAVARAIIDAGWHASRVDVEAETLTLAPGQPPGRA